MDKTVYCRFCGWEFEPRNNHHFYCSRECRHFDLKRKNKKETKKSNYPSIEDAVDIMLKLSDERGRVVQYGEFQTMLYTGKIKIKDGVIE